MQTVASKCGWLRWFFVAALYVSVFGCATPTTAPIVAAPAPAPAPVAPVPATPPPPPVVIEAVPAPAPLESAALPPVVSGPPHIALILPLNSSIYAKAADAVKQGFLAAAGKEANGLPVIVYPCKDESTEVVALYQKALGAGAVTVAGPLTRDGVAALAAGGQLKHPALALNLMENTARVDMLYFFGLPPETEARQAAQRATAAGLLSATVVSTDTPLSKRLAQAFSDEWQREGGILRAEIDYNGDPAPLKELSQEPGNSVFLAAELDKARLIRPYINSAIPVYATSQIFSGNTSTLTNYDLADVHFFDMPWMLQPDHPAVMIYPHVTPVMTPDMERLYALGIDSYRLLQVLSAHNPANALPLDGVTGKISLNGHVFQREGVLAVMRQGQGVPVDSKSRP